MAFTDNVLSSVPVPSQWLGAGGEALISRLRDAEDGPIAEQDPSEGHDYQQWVGLWRDGQVLLSADNQPERVLLDDPLHQITDFSFCFNQNADVNYAYVEGGVAYLRYYSTLDSRFSTMRLGTQVNTPKVTLDDKRPAQSGRSDVLLCYVNAAGKLCLRLQRDRFLNEYVLDDGPFMSIEKMYMNQDFRMQWEMVAGDGGTTPPNLPEAPLPYVRMSLAPETIPEHPRGAAGWELDVFGRLYPYKFQTSNVTYTVQGAEWYQDGLSRYLEVLLDKPIAGAGSGLLRVSIAGKRFVLHSEGTAWKAQLDETEFQFLQSLPFSEQDFLMQIPNAWDVKPVED